MSIKKRGFASMDEDRQREISRQGGIVAHAKGTAHKFTSETAKEAGRKRQEQIRRVKNASTEGKKTIA